MHNKREAKRNFPLGYCASSKWLYLILVALPCWVFTSCSYEIESEGNEVGSYSGQDTSPINIELQQSFIELYSEQQHTRHNTPSDTLFGFQGLQPLWSESRTTWLNDSIEITEVPLRADGAYLPVSSSVADLLDDETYRDKTNFTYLIRKKNHANEARSLDYFMSVMPNREMLLSGRPMQHTPGLIPNEFSGEVLFFNLKGEVQRKHIYERGYIIDDLIPQINPKEGTSQTRSIATWQECHLVEWRTDYYYYVEIRGERSEPKYNYSSYHYTWECTTRVSFSSATPEYDDVGGGGREWVPYEYGGGGGGGYYSGQEIKPVPPEKKDHTNFLKERLITDHIKKMWKEILEVATETSRQEKGFFLYYCTVNNQYYVGNIRTGTATENKENTKGTIHPFHPQPRYNGSHIPLTAQPIAFIHGHTPLLGKDVLYREVGLSESDRTWAETHNTVVIAHDYVGEYDPELKKQIIRTGHDKNGPTKNYIALPLKAKE